MICSGEWSRLHKEEINDFTGEYRRLYKEELNNFHWGMEEIA